MTGENIDAQRAAVYDRLGELDKALAEKLLERAELHRKKAGLEIMLAEIYRRRASS